MIFSQVKERATIQVIVNLKKEANSLEACEVLVIYAKSYEIS